MPWFIRVPVLHVAAITLWFVVLYRGSLTERTARHETIHFYQYNETWVIGFLLIYFWDWLRSYVGLVKSLGVCGAFWPAYERIRFEQEAFAHDTDPNYLDNRQKNAWRAYAR